MVRPAGWSGCGSSPTVLPSRRGAIIGRQKGIIFESKLTISSPPSLGRSAVERPIQCADPRLAARMERHLRYGVEQRSYLRNGCLGLLQALSYRPTKTTRRCINGFALGYRSHRSWVLWLVQTHR